MPSNNNAVKWLREHDETHEATERPCDLKSKISRWACCSSARLGLQKDSYLVTEYRDSVNISFGCKVIGVESFILDIMQLFNLFLLILTRALSSKASLLHRYESLNKIVIIST